MTRRKGGNKMASDLMEFKLKGGILMIGSLYWQDHRDVEGDGIRRQWREERLDMANTVDVKVPIRYGRFSKNLTYTMVFDISLPEELYGTAKAVPFHNSPLNTFAEIKEEVSFLSNVEGKYCSNFLKAGSDNLAWCLCSVLFHPNRVKEPEKMSVLERWSKEFRLNPKSYESFVSNPLLSAVRPTGELNIPWPKGAGGFDFLIATANKPVLREGVGELTAKEIANRVSGRDYFWPNQAHGISTYQDEEIKKNLNK
jgi:hypothetical protein